MQDIARDKTNKVNFTSSALIKFLICSIIGIIIFFVNININGSSKVPLIHTINLLKDLVGKQGKYYLVAVACVSVLGTSLWAKLDKNAPVLIKEHHKRDSVFSYFTYITAAIFSLMIVFNIGPEIIVDPKVGISSINVAGDVMFAGIVAGSLVVFLTEFGLLEFLGKLLEPIMRVLFKVPGKSAIDALSSFVCAPSVGVMITNGLYKKGVYTDKEACSITTNFSIASLGGFAFLSAMAGVGDYYSQIVLSALVITFLVAIVMIRIPPLSRKKDVYYDGRNQTAEERKPGKYDKYIIKEAVEAALTKAETVEVSAFWSGFKSALQFAQKVPAYIVSLSVICLAIANYTPIAKYLGMPMVPILNMLGLPDAEIIAPSTLVGFLALSLPATLITGKEIAAISGFFVVVLSTTQIIFFTESANAMLDSDIPLNFFDLLIIFIERTIILVPLVAVIARIVFGV